MMQDCNVIGKGSYSDFRFNDFVSVRQYLLIREKGKKYLILKLKNDSTDTVNGIKLAVEQIDVRGRCIDTSHVEWNVDGKAGEMFVPQDKIPLKENCMEVRINLVGAVYGDYTYAVKSNQLVVTYDKKPTVKDKDYSHNTDGEKLVVSERKFKASRLLMFVAIGVLIMAIASSILQVSIFKKSENEFIWHGINYEFIGSDKEGESPIRVVGYTGLTDNVVIPKEIQGHPIQEIAPKAFYKERSLESIRIEAEVEIPQGAFEGCNNLKTAELIGVTRIGSNAFHSCQDLENVTARNLESIGARAFAYCKKLKNLDVSNNEKELAIEEFAFVDCNMIKTLILDQAVRYTASMNAFSGVSQVQELTLKNYNSELFEEATDKTLERLFYGKKPSALTRLTIKDIDTIPQGFCEDLVWLESVTLGGVASDTISQRAFKGCQKLTSLDIQMEEGVAIKKVEDYAFYKNLFSSFDGAQLEQIGIYAFAENSRLTSVALKSNGNLSVLGEGAFKNCTSLESVQIGANLTEIKNSTFENCSSLANVTFGSGSELQSIGYAAFMGCKSLTKIEMPATVAEIGGNAFMNCKAALTITLPSSLRTIGENAFFGCDKVKSVEVPSATTYIGKGAFNCCSSLTSITVPFVGCSPDENKYLAAIFGGETLEDSLLVPASLTKVTVTGDYDVEYGAFYNLNNIKQVYFTGNFYQIGAEAFMNCSNLRELRLSPTLRTIGNNAFSNCYLLFEVYNDSSLQIERGSLEFGGVGYHALAVYDANNSTRLERAEKNGFTFLKAPEGWYLTDHVSDENIWVLPQSFATNNGEATSYAMVAHLFERRKDVKELTVTGGVSSLGESVFYDCNNLEKLTFANDVNISAITDHAFANAYALKSVEFDNGCNIASIDSNAFTNCIYLEHINICDSVKAIGEYAFFGCSSLIELHLGENIERIGYGALSRANGLQELTVPFIGESRTSNNYMGHIFGIDIEQGYNAENLRKISVLNAPIVHEKAFYNFINLQEVQLPQTTEEIGNYAFANCYLLEQCNFPSSLTIIGIHAFAFTNIKNVALPAGLTSLGEGVFFYSNIESLSIRNTNIVEIPYDAFANCYSLNSVDMTNSSVQNIGDYAFANTLIKQISFPAGVSSIGVQAFYNTDLTSLTIGGTISHIGDSAFAYCDNLQSVSIISSRLKQIPYGAFSYCTNLKEVALNSGLTEIEAGAFEECSLSEISLPSSVTTIREYAFSYCVPLSSVRLSANMEFIGDGAFYGCNQLYEVYNPSNLTITRGNDNHGGIASNAIIVHRSLNAAKLATETVKGLVFKYAPTEGEVCLFSYEGVITDLDVQSVNLGGRLYTSYWIHERAFIYNNDLIEVNTGAAVEEIGEFAFAYCSQLRKVSIGSGLKEGKLAQTAFYDCQRLWEVQDSNPNYNVLKGSEDCGYVAYYAVAVNQTITYKTQGDFEFMGFGGSWYLYNYNGSQSAKLPEIGSAYAIFKHEKLQTYPFGSLQYGSYLIIPTTVFNIYPGVFGYTIPTIYYLGTQTSWSNITKNAGLSGANVYYYSNCVHNYYKGTSYWTYVKGLPSTNETSLSSTTQEATCKSEGLITYKCDTCKETLTTVVLGMVNHSFGNKGTCTWCGKTSVQEGELGSKVSINNTSLYKFLKNDSQNFYSDWNSAYGQFNSNMEIQAHEDIHIEFTIRCVLPTGASGGVYLNGSRLEWFDSNGSAQVSCDLTANDILRFEIRNNSMSSSEARIYIEDIVITQRVKE